MRIGVDVGGTNTDAVIMNGREVLHGVKSATTEEPGLGIINAVSDILEKTKISPNDLESVMIGTTQFTNAFVENKRLEEVAIVRLAYPATISVPPCIDFSDNLRNILGNNFWIVPGGYEFDGRYLGDWSETEIEKVAKEISQKKLKYISISCVFSPINEKQEILTADIIKKYNPESIITMSHRIGRVGFIERENATIMNSSLGNLADKVITSFNEALIKLNIKCPFYISQNDGTLMSANIVKNYPVLTFASGPTNSMRGAAFLSGHKNAIVVDIGGTTTDFGVIKEGFPRESAIPVDIGGVRTNFRMPDLISIGLGGGSLVTNVNNNIEVGPESVGFKLTSESLIFGGNKLTASDIAIAKGLSNFGNKDNVSNLDKNLIDNTIIKIKKMIEDGIDRVKLNKDLVPVILVGGGSILVEGNLEGAEEVIIPKHSDVANAIGASLAQAGGEIDKIYSYNEIGRDKSIENAKNDAINRALQAGAIKETISIIELEEIPLSYLPSGAVRLHVKAVGDIF
ncbi:MAG: Acetophenone carboxylase gamma subunit [Alphaproteobacteria bacterium MarineAlpha5_Bin9]|nr:MAG: Acetophenone carboxylase gamma subunit [Alphaproteobacteria bacterium MarineAlpha5_Bin9]|tara:strand:+ start:5833 stop:7374 length:1542 start_codon:yes stop_codon:yes gene_type:complete